MSFRATEISLAGFRNYERFICGGFGILNIMVGPNAIGKTNLLEAIQLTTALSSFRRPQIQELIGWGKSSAKVELRVADGERRNEVFLTVSEGQRQYLLNGKRVKRLDLAGLVPAVLFSPDDLRLVKDGSSVRRRAVDEMGEQISRNYRAVRQDYEKIIRQKNKLLKDGASRFYLESINDTVLTVGTQLESYRQQIAREVQALLEDVHRDMTGRHETLRFVHYPSWVSDEDQNGASDAEYCDRGAIREAFARALEASVDQELLRGRSLVGPHLDHPRFFLDGRDAALYGSQGQQRSVALSFKMAELLYMREKTGHQPLLLLDDVMSELDEVRRGALMAYISRDTQTFITTTNVNYFTDRQLAEAQVFALENMTN